MTHPAARLGAFARERARALGFSFVGITGAEPSQHIPFLLRWLAAGRHGEMDYLARPDAVHRRGDLRRTVAEARSVIVVGHEYGTGGEQDTGPDRAVIARYARGRDYHKVVKKGLQALLRELDDEARRRGLDGGVAGRAYVDTGPILERELGRRAGLGWFGRNTMLIHPRRGSYFFLGALLVDADLESDAPFEADRCGTCRNCLDVCPTGALLGRDADGAPVMDATRCISYLTIELRGPIPRDLRPAVGNRVFGCDICQEVCPFNTRFGEGSSDPSYGARGPGEPPFGVEVLPADGEHPGTDSPSLIELLETALDEPSWELLSRGSPIRRAGRAGFARNLCVGLGNWGSDEAVPVLAAALADPEPIVRAHAAWALGRVGSAGARTALAAAVAGEGEPEVLEEISEALDAADGRGWARGGA